MSSVAVEVERAAGTRTIANLWRRAEARTGTAYMVETEGEWHDVSLSRPGRVRHLLTPGGLRKAARRRAARTYRRVRPHDL